LQNFRSPFQQGGGGVSSMLIAVEFVNIENGRGKDSPKFESGEADSGSVKALWTAQSITEF